MKFKTLLLIFTVLLACVFVACVPQEDSQSDSPSSESISITQPDSESIPESNSISESISESHTESDSPIVDGLTIENGVVVSYSGTQTEIVIPSVYQGEPVTKIGDRAFQETNVVCVTIPSSIIEIGDYAFGYCHKLVNVIFNEGLKMVGEGAFFDCPKIEKMLFPNSLEKLGCGALGNVLVLKDFENGEVGVTTADSALSELYVPFIGESKSVSAYSFFAFTFGVTSPAKNRYDADGFDFDYNGETIKINLYNVIPESLKKVTVGCADLVPDASFYNCFYLEEINVQSTNLISIGKYAFEGCKNANVTGVKDAMFIADRAFFGSSFKGADFVNLVSIGNYAFWQNPIKDFSFGSELTTIGDGAFGFTQLETVYFPETIESIGDNAFYACNNLTTVYFESPTPCAMGDTLFTIVENDMLYYSDVLIFVPENDGDLSPYKEYRKDIYLRDYASGIFSIKYENQSGYIVEDGALVGYVKNAGEDFSHVEVPVGVTEIADFAFYNCAKIEKITLPEGFTKIGEYAFYNCTGVKNLYMPSTLKEIDDYAFTGFFVGNYLTRLYFPEGLERIGDGAFMSSFNLKIIDIPSTIKYMGYLSFGMANNLERMYFRATTPPEVGFYDNKLEEIDRNFFSMVNSSKTIIYVPSGKCTSGENAGKSYHEIFVNADGFKDFAQYVKPSPDGVEVGHYGDGDVYIDLDGCNRATVYTMVESAEDTSSMGGSKYEYKKEYGDYTLNGAMLNITFEEFGVVNAVYGNRVITFNKDGVVHTLSEPKRFYDSYNWTNFVLYNYEKGSGKGSFDMYGSFLTPFEWSISGTSFTLKIDGNNKTHPDYAGIVEYDGNYDPFTDSISVAFMLNDYEEIITYTASAVTTNYATAKEEKLYGTYVCYGANDYKMFTIVSYGNGFADFYIGESVYENCSYSVDGSLITISVTALTVSVTIDKDGNLYSDNLMGVECFFVYEDEVLDSTVLPD